VVVVSKIVGGGTVTRFTLVDVTGGNVRVVVLVWGGVVGCGRGGNVVKVVVGSIVSDTGSVGVGSNTGRVVEGASLVVVDSCRVVGGRLVAGRTMVEGTGSVVEGATF
jgi:hypothetical protein